MINNRLINTQAEAPAPSVISYKNNGGISEVTFSSSININYPSSILTGNMLVMYVYVYTGSSSGSVTYPSISGWTLQGSNDAYGWMAMGVYTRTGLSTDGGFRSISFSSSYSRIFGVMAQYESDNSVSYVNGSIDINDGQIGANTYNNINTSPSTGGLYIASFGQAGSGSVSVSSTTYTEDVIMYGSLNSIILVSYSALPNEDDSDVVLSANSVNQSGGLILQ